LREKRNLCAKLRVEEQAEPWTQKKIVVGENERRGLSSGRVAVALPKSVSSIGSHQFQVGSLPNRSLAHPREREAFNGSIIFRMKTMTAAYRFEAMWMYLLVFLAALIVDRISMFAPVPSASLAA
jgi:hypothetical protein